MKALNINTNQEGFKQFKRTPTRQYCKPLVHIFYVCVCLFVLKRVVIIYGGGGGGKN